MPHTKIYGRTKDGNYVFPVTFHELTPTRIQALFFDDKDAEVTSDTWMTHTTDLIKELTDVIGGDKNVIKNIEPTMNPPYSIRIAVDFSHAVEVQDKLDAHIKAIHSDLYTT
jgi:hypothetical protein